MIIYLTEEEKNLTKEYTPIKDKCKTKKEKDILTMYRKGYPVEDIKKAHNISSGMLYTVINNHKEGKRNITKNLYRKIAHIIENPNKVQNLIDDYKKLPTKELFKKYDIHKNGLYYILDLYNVERKTPSKEEVLSDKIVIEE